MNIILCLDKKGPGPKAQLLPSKVPILVKRRQLSADTFLRARSPDPAQLSLLKEAGVQDLDGPEAPQAVLQQGPAQTVSLQRTAIIRSQRWG